MKSEPACYAIDDLRLDGVGMWEGCRNYTVRNFLRDAMSVGDKAFFYHSGADPVGIAGEMEIVSDAFADPTQFDPESEYFDAKSNRGTPRWLARDVKFVKKYDRIIRLSELRTEPGLAGMEVLRRGQRLSVMPVAEDEWEIVRRMAERSRAVGL